MSSDSNRRERRQLLARVVEALIAAHCGGPSLQAFDAEPAAISNQGIGAA